MPDDDDTVEIDLCEAVRETEKAMLVSIDGGDPIWIPKSQIKNEEWFGVDEVDTLVITKWFARKAGLV